MQWFIRNEVFFSCCCKDFSGTAFPSVSLILRIIKVACEICTFLDPTSENQKLPWTVSIFVSDVRNLVDWHDQGSLGNITQRDFFKTHGKREWCINLFHIKVIPYIPFSCVLLRNSEAFQVSVSRSGFVLFSYSISYLSLSLHIGDPKTLCSPPFYSLSLPNKWSCKIEVPRLGIWSLNSSSGCNSELCDLIPPHNLSVHIRTIMRLHRMLFVNHHQLNIVTNIK